MQVVKDGPIGIPGLVGYGVVTWLVPFAVSIFLVGRDGAPRLPPETFKSIMIVVGCSVGAWLLVKVFRRSPRFGHPGIVVGTLWLAINIVLDLAVLVPMTQMSLPSYFGDIGLRYLVIPIVALALDVATTP